MELIKLRVKEDSNNINSKIIVDSFIESCVKLDASIFEKLIVDEDQYFEGKNKYDFLSFLKAQFDHAKKIGLDKTIVGSGICQLCNKGCRSLEFNGADGKIRFAYMIEEVEGKVKDIYNCNASSGWFKK